jgi:CIC family chloride channel protein
VMSRDIGMVPEDLPLEQVAMLVRETHHHGFPVGNAEGDLIGIVTLSDVENALLQGRREVTAGDICTRSLLVCHPDETLGEALRQLGARDVGRLPVVDRKHPRRLVGMLRRADVVVAYSRFAQERQEERAARALAPAVSGPRDPLGGLRFVELRLPADSAAVGRPVRDLELPGDCILVSIRRGDHTLIPRGDTVLEAGDRIFALGHFDSTLALEEGLAAAITISSLPRAKSRAA